MREYYEILGLSEGATVEEIEKAYFRLKKKYSEERFLEGEKGNDAAKNLTKVETAYRELTASLSEKTEKGKNDYSKVEELIRSGAFNDAQSELDNIFERDAEWHYLQSVVFYKKNWINESKKQLEIAMNMDPENEKYKTAYNKLLEKITFNEKQFHSGNTDTVGGDRQMGGDSMNSCLSFCATWCCVNMLCNLCCRL